MHNQRTKKQKQKQKNSYTGSVNTPLMMDKYVIRDASPPDLRKFCSIHLVQKNRKMHIFMKFLSISGKFDQIH